MTNGNEVQPATAYGSGGAFLTAGQAAEYTQRHPKTVVLAARSGQLHGYQTTGKFSHWRFRKECLEAWMSGLKCKHHRSQRDKIPA